MISTRTRSDPRIVLMALPFLVGAVVLVVGPAVLTVVLALFEWDLVGSARWHGLAGFRALLDDDVFKIALRNSIAFAAVSVPLRLVGVLGLALLLHARRRGATTARTVVTLPAFLPDIALGIAWLWIANPLYGPLNGVLAGVGLSEIGWLTEPDAARSLVVMMSLFTIGEGVLVAIAVRNQIRPEYYELAEVEGVGPLRTFRSVTWPIMAPALGIIALRDVAFAFQASFVPALVVTEGGPPPYSTTYLPLLAYRNSFEYLRYGYGAAITAVMLAVTALALIVLRGTARRRDLS